MVVVLETTEPALVQETLDQALADGGLAAQLQLVGLTLVTGDSSITASPTGSSSISTSNSNGPSSSSSSAGATKSVVGAAVGGALGGAALLGVGVVLARRWHQRRAKARDGTADQEYGLTDGTTSAGAGQRKAKVGDRGRSCWRWVAEHLTCLPCPPERSPCKACPCSLAPMRAALCCHVMQMSPLVKGELGAGLTVVANSSGRSRLGDEATMHSSNSPHLSRSVTPRHAARRTMLVPLGMEA